MSSSEIARFFTTFDTFEKHDNYFSEEDPDPTEAHISEISDLLNLYQKEEYGVTKEEFCRSCFKCITNWRDAEPLDIKAKMKDMRQKKQIEAKTESHLLGISDQLCQYQMNFKMTKEEFCRSCVEYITDWRAKPINLEAKMKNMWVKIKREINSE